MFIIGLLLLGVTFVTLYLTGALYNATDERHINAYVFQPNNISSDRIGRPVPAENLSEKFVRERLIKKFITEYFYVTPDVENIAERQRPSSVLAALSSPDVFKTWRNTVGADIENMAGKKFLRTVRFPLEIVMAPGSDYWDVIYELVTWDEPNNFDNPPLIETGVIHLKVSFERGIRDQRGGTSFDVQKYLNEGGDPAAIFKFRVDEVRR